jgi:hypothetical protein
MSAKRTLFTRFNIPGGRLGECSFLGLLEDSGGRANVRLGVTGEGDLSGVLCVEPEWDTYFVVPMRCLVIPVLCLGLARSAREAELDFGRLFGVDDAAGTEARCILVWVAERVLGV